MDRLGYLLRMLWSLKRAADWVGYGTKWFLLNIYGPADQDPSVDPLQQLKREHGREPDV